MKSIRTIDVRDDSGTTLLLALIFMGVFSIVLGALIPDIAAGISNSTIVRDFDARLYTADSALDMAIQQLRWDPTLCPDPTAGQQAVPLQPVDPRVTTSNVSLACKTDFGSSDAAQGYAVITTDPAGNSLNAGLGGSKLIDGPVWTTGLAASPNKLTVGGPLREISGGYPCPGLAPATTGGSGDYGTNALTVSPPFAVTCLPSGSSPPLPTVTPPDPSSLSTLANSGGFTPPALNLGSCHVFKPGVYSAPPQLGTDNYLASGVYWFNNVSWTVDKTVIGGAIGPGDSYSNSAGKTACSNDAAVESPNGEGVTIVLAGTSSINVSGGLLELFNRADDANGTQGISVETTTSWSGSTALSIATGSGQSMTLHGLIYAPNATVSIGATSAPQANVLGGVVAQDLTLDHSASVSNGTLISVRSGVGFRHMLVSATVAGSNGGRDVVATAVIDIQNDNARTVTIESRRNSGYTTTS